MDEGTIGGAAPPAQCGDWKPLLLLFALAVGMRAWQLTHTEVAARDSIGYIRMAWQLEHRPWAEAVRQAPQHPLYPLTVLLLSHPVRAALPHTDLALAMQWSAQLASALAGVLLVLPAFLLGRDLFDRRVGFWGALLMQTLPASGRLLADGLSESLFLLLAVSGLWAAVRALRGSSPWWFALTGLCSGLAYLTRLEGAFVAAATGLVLLASQAVPAWRRPWGRLVACGVTLAGVALLLAAPFMLAIGHYTNKASVKRVEQQMVLLPLDDGGPAAVSGAPLALWHWGAYKTGPETRTWWAPYAVGFELVGGFFYVLWLPALVGLVVTRGLFRREPGAWVLLVTGAAVTLGVYSIAWVVGYASERHLLLVILCGCYWAVPGCRTLVEETRRRLPALARLSPAALTAALLGLVCVVTGAKSLERLHGDRGGFREAGLWLAGHAPPGADIEDPYAWAGYYAGRVFEEVTPPALPQGPPAAAYVVLEESVNDHSHLPEVERARERVRKYGQRLQGWKVPRGQVVVYEVNGPATALPGQ